MELFSPVAGFQFIADLARRGPKRPLGPSSVNWCSGSSRKYSSRSDGRVHKGWRPAVLWPVSGKEWIKSYGRFQGGAGRCAVIHNVHSSCPRRPKDLSKGPQVKRGTARGAVAVGGCG